ncbi:MAG: universal stress protein [Burkholderiaceae bacterium]
MKVLLAVDGSDCSSKAVDYLVSKSGLIKENSTVHVVTVRLPISNAQGRSVALANQQQIDQYQKEEAQAVLVPVEEALRKSGFSVTSSFSVGDAASR